MSKEIRSKTLAIFVVLAMVLSTMMVVRFSAPVNAANGGDVSTGIGIDDFEGGYNYTAGNYSYDFVNTSTTQLYYDNTVTIQFNKSVLNNFTAKYGSTYFYLYYPVYTWDYSTDKYNVTWRKWTNPPTNPQGRLSPEGKIENVHLNVSGFWFVCDQLSITKTNFTNASYMKVYNGTSWTNITGWFWVNSTKYYTVEVSPSTIHYDKNETVTITVKHGDETVGGVWCDIIKDNRSGSGEYYVVRHEYMDTGTWSFNPYDYTHDFGAGTYNIRVYKDIDTTVIGYGAEGDHTGYNNTFGDTSIWSMTILNSSGKPSTSNELTYSYDACGPFDPPEYVADIVNLTVVAGVPTLSIPEANATQYWSFDGTVNVTIKDYDGNNITTPYAVIVLDDDKDNVTSHFNISKHDGYCIISPNMTEAGTNGGWGKNSSSVYGHNGTWRIRIVKTDVGNASEEWNGTIKFTVTKAPGVQIKLIDDDGSLSTDNDNDGVIPKVPWNTTQPITIKFKVISRTHDYLGDGDYETDMKNITISGNALMLEDGKTLYKYNDSLSGVVSYDSSSHVWSVNITPTMALNGGEITISVDWGSFGTATQTISIGGSKLNGTIVSISPSEFVIGENVTLTVTVTGPTGYPYPNAYVALYYINDSGDLWGKINETNGGGTTNGEYTFFFNVSQQTTGQPWSTQKAPRYIAAYVNLSNVGAGYAYAKMKPKSDLKVEMSKDTFMAGQLTDFWVNVSVVNANGNKTGNPDINSTNKLYVKIYNETGVDVTDTLDSDDSLSDDLTGDSSGEYTFKLSAKHLDKPGTYTVYAYNNTHNSEGFNATFTVVPVTVTCDKSEFIYMYDDNISATFTVKWQGVPVNGTLIIYNMTKPSGSDYNKTWTNYSDDHTKNKTIELEVVNGVATMHNITANYLPANKGTMYVTFEFTPEESGSTNATATGRIPVKVPDATPDPSEVALNEPANVEVTVTGRGEPLEGVFVSIDGPGNLAMNGTTGADGTITFSFVPTATGDVNIKVYNRSTGSKITVTAHTLSIDAPAQVNEGEEFTVTVKDESGNVVSDAQVTFSGTGETKTTDSSGKVTFTGTVSGTLPYVTYKLTATKAGYKSDEESITIVGVPQLYIEAPATVDAGSTFTVKVTSDTGAVYGVDVTFNGETKTITGPSGVTFTAPSVTKETPYTITATKEGYKDATADITVKPAGVPGFELITLIAAIGIAFILLRRRH